MRNISYRQLLGDLFAGGHLCVAFFPLHSGDIGT